jgi:branched-subunit amino acid ABC-type transport system permease component
VFIACDTQAMASYPKIQTLAIADMDFTWSAAGGIKQTMSAKRVPTQRQARSVFSILEILIASLFASYVLLNIVKIYWGSRRRRVRLSSVRLAAASASPSATYALLVEAGCCTAIVVVLRVLRWALTHL